MCAVIPYRGFKSLSLRQGLKAFMHCIGAFIAIFIVFASKVVYNSSSNIIFPNVGSSPNGLGGKRPFCFLIFCFSRTQSISVKYHMIKTS